MEIFGIPFTGQNIAFFVLALIILLSGVSVLLLDKLMHMAVALGGVFLGVAGIFILLGADFLGIVQVMIYAGAITILMVFALMLTQKGDETRIPSAHPVRQWVTLIGVVAFVGILIDEIRRVQWPVTQNAVEPFTKPTINLIADALYHSYMIPFELISLLLTAALVGAVLIARKEEN